ncbi:MAG TPA: glycosyltransferase family 1 protein [Opitutaceae bacterium]|jgi:glycosyltransferase involved in cell wall biosynthesis|nr:glycosyltransferase family 1 protein [Opitutaceae bacterium]
MPRKLKLALVSETFPPEVNGVAMTFGVIAGELGRRGHEVTVFRPSAGPPAAEAARRHFHEVSLPGLPIPGYSALRFGLPAACVLRRRWRSSRPDLVHVVTEGPLGASAITAARDLAIPVTSSFHTNFHSYTRHYRVPWLRPLALAWLRRVHNRTRRTFVPTAELCRELTGQGFRHLQLLSRGIDTRHFRPERRSPALRASWGAEPADPVVIHVGRMAPEKNYPLLFRAYDAMRAANPRCRFVIAGEGPLRERLMRQQPGCVFAGFFPREEIGRYYASADVYIHASLTETFGNVLTEAMASGLAVAGFDYAAAAQFVRPGESGLTMPCDRPEELIAAAVRLATEPELRQRLREAARRAVDSQAWEKVITLFETDLQQVIAEAGTPAIAPQPLPTSNAAA